MARRRRRPLVRPRPADRRGPSEVARAVERRLTYRRELPFVERTAWVPSGRRGRIPRRLAPWSSRPASVPPFRRTPSWSTLRRSRPYLTSPSHAGSRARRRDRRRVRRPGPGSSPVASSGSGPVNGSDIEQKYTRELVRGSATDLDPGGPDADDGDGRRTRKRGRTAGRTERRTSARVLPASLRPSPADDVPATASGRRIAASTINPFACACPRE